MLDDKGFNLWADDYDKSVGVSDEEGTYPFAGYKNILNGIYNRVLSGTGKKVLDIGFGTGTLTTKLYEQGCTIFGQDFSERMIALAQEKMPEARLYQGDFSLGLVSRLRQEKYDAIIATYSLHHLTDEQKVKFIQGLLPLLNEGGTIYIGDVAFETRAKMDECRAQVGDEWDDEEIYFVYEELKKELPELKFEKLSECAGLLMLRRDLEIENEMYGKAVELIEKRYPVGWGGAGVVRTSNGNYYTSVPIETANASATVCIETGAMLEAHKYNEKVTHCMCLVREDGKSQYRVLSPCGICQERLRYWGEDVQVAVTTEENDIRFVTLKELQPYHWTKAYPAEELEHWGE